MPSLVFRLIPFAAHRGCMKPTLTATNAPSTQEQLAPGDLLTPAEAAELLRTTPGQLSQLRFRHEGPTFLKFGRKVLYRRTDLTAYANGAVVEFKRYHLRSA